MIHLYALARRPELPWALVGIDGADLVVVSCGVLHAIGSEHATAPPPDRDRALQHAAVVGALADRLAVLPLRFGAVHQDRHTVQATVRAQTDGLVRALDRVGGHAEYVVRLARAPGRAAQAPITRTLDRVPVAGSGRAYLELRLAELRAAHDAEQVSVAQLRALTEPLTDHAAVALERAGPFGPERCYLVGRDELATFTSVAAACLEGRDELMLGGPWPPFTFALEAIGS